MICGAPTANGTPCQRSPMHASTTRRCMGHETAPDVAARLRDARSRGGHTTGRRRQEERAKRAQERFDLGNEAAIGVYLGVAGKLAVSTRDASHAAAAAKVAEVALGCLDHARLKDRVRELEQFIFERHPEARR